MEDNIINKPTMACHLQLIPQDKGKCMSSPLGNRCEKSSIFFWYDNTDLEPHFHQNYWVEMSTLEPYYD